MAFGITIESRRFVKLLPKIFAPCYGCPDIPSIEVSSSSILQLGRHEFEGSILLHFCDDSNQDRVLFNDFINLVYGNLLVI